MASTVIPQTTQFPCQIKKEIVFTAQNQEDVDYLNSKEKDGDFICDLKEFYENIAMDIFSVDDVTL